MVIRWNKVFLDLVTNTTAHTMHSIVGYSGAMVISGNSSHNKQTKAAPHYRRPTVDAKIKRNIQDILNSDGWDKGALLVINKRLVFVTFAPDVDENTAVENAFESGEVLNISDHAEVLTMINKVVSGETRKRQVYKVETLATAAGFMQVIYRKTKSASIKLVKYVSDFLEGQVVALYANIGGVNYRMVKMDDRDTVAIEYASTEIVGGKPVASWTGLSEFEFTYNGMLALQQYVTDVLGLSSLRKLRKN